MRMSGVKCWHLQLKPAVGIQCLCKCTCNHLHKPQPCIHRQPYIQKMIWHFGQSYKRRHVFNLSTRKYTFSSLCNNVAQLNSTMLPDVHFVLLHITFQNMYCMQGQVEHRINMSNLTVALLCIKFKLQMHLDLRLMNSHTYTACLALIIHTCYTNVWLLWQVYNAVY